MNFGLKCEYSNKVRKPRDGTISYSVWKVIDKSICESGQTASFSMIRAELPNVNVNTITTQLGQYLRFHGIKIKRGDLISDKRFKL